MTTSQLIIGIESCVKYGQRQEAVRRTWLKDCALLGVRAYFLVGRPGQKSIIDGDILYLDCGDGYLDLPRKTIAFLRFVEENLDFTYIYKCDDDTYVNLSALLNLSIEPYDYGGFQYTTMSTINMEWHVKHVEAHLRNQSYPGTYLGPWMTGGSGYFLSKRALQCAINEHHKFINKEFYEDKLIGDIMKTNRISFLVLESLKEILAIDFSFLRRNLLAYASFHPCSSREMAWLYHQRNFLFMLSFFSRFIFLKLKVLLKLKE